MFWMLVLFQKRISFLGWRLSYSKQKSIRGIRWHVQNTHGEVQNESRTMKARVTLLNNRKRERERGERRRKKGMWMEVMLWKDAGVLFGRHMVKNSLLECKIIDGQSWDGHFMSSRCFSFTNVQIWNIIQTECFSISLILQNGELNKIWTKGLTF